MSKLAEKSKQLAKSKRYTVEIESWGNGEKIKCSD